MIEAWRKFDTSARVLLIAAVVLVGFVLLAGGASRADAMSQPFVRMVSVAALGLALYHINWAAFSRARLPLLFICAVAASIAVQLVPLPPGLWAVLPGRSFYQETLDVVGLAGAWRPLSMTPDLTINALLALLPAAAALALSAALPDDAQTQVVKVLLVGTILTVALAVLQISGINAYLYRITNKGLGVGLFANRNHQAMFIACSLPLLAYWSALKSGMVPLKYRAWIALLLSALLFPLILLTGSRSGLILLVIAGFGATLLTIGSGRASRGARGPVLANWQRWIPLALGVIAILTTILLSRGMALQRLSETNEGELRFTLVPTYLQMIRDFFPVGSGFGSFDPIFRRYEPDGMLNAFYMNQAHSDFLQVMIEGGLAAALLGCAFSLWYLVATFRAWRKKPVSSGDLLARAGAIVILVLLLGSLADYPLRTPTLSSLFALSCWWLHRGSASAAAERWPSRLGSPSSML